MPPLAPRRSPRGPLACSLALAGCNQLAEGIGRVALAIAVIWLMMLGLYALAQAALLARGLQLLVRGRRPGAGLVATALGLLAVHASFAYDTYRGLASAGVARGFHWLVCASLALPVFSAVLVTLGAAAPRLWRAARLGLAGAAGAAVLALAALALRPWSDAPVPASGAPAELAIGRGHACVLTSTGDVMAFGDNEHGQLGTGPTPRQRARPSVVPGLRGVTALACGDEHCCALSGGRALCWGSNRQGQLGPGLPEQIELPVALPDVARAVEVRARGDATWIRADGRLRFFGKGELGDGAADEAVPADTAQLAVGERFLCLRRSAELECRLRNLGSVSLPLGPSRDLAATEREVCVAGADGAVRCVAPFDAFAERERETQSRAAACEIAERRRLVLAQSPAGRRLLAREGPPGPCDLSAPPVRLPALRGLSDVVELAAGPRHLCGRTAAGQVWCWGDGFRGQLGDGKAERYQTEPQPTALSGPASRIFAADSLSCALGQDRRLRCWGSHTPLTSSAGQVKCHDTWLGDLYCVPRPAEVDALGP